MEKLIRDKISIIPHPEYINMETRKVWNIIEHIHFLLLKIQEEQQEFNDATSIDKTEEAGDMLEIYDTLIDLYESLQKQQERESIIHKREALISIMEYSGFNIVEVILIQSQNRENIWWFKEGTIWLQY